MLSTQEDLGEQFQFFEINPKLENCMVLIGDYFHAIVSTGRRACE